jgi:hypothetical protein
MSRLFQDTMTDQMRHDLSIFCYQQGYLDEPVLGHFPADLLFGQKEADADQQAQPDDHYYQAQGEEPPRVRCFRRMLTWLLFWLFIGELVLLFWPGLV